MNFFKTMHLFYVLLIFLAILMIMNFLTFTGSINFIKHLTNKDSLLVPKTLSTILLSILLSNILTAVKERLQMYCATVYARKVVNQMWILKKA
jgi:hypothetical protein